MTDRLSALVVVLERDLRTDDAQATIDAIMQIKGVLRVDSHVTSVEAHVAEKRARYEIMRKLLALADEEL